MSAHPQGAVRPSADWFSPPRCATPCLCATMCPARNARCANSSRTIPNPSRRRWSTAARSPIRPVSAAVICNADFRFPDERDASCLRKRSFRFVEQSFQITLFGSHTPFFDPPVDRFAHRPAIIDKQVVTNGRKPACDDRIPVAGQKPIIVADDHVV